MSRRARSRTSRRRPACPASSAPLRIFENNASRSPRINSPIACSPIGAAALSTWALIASSSALCPASHAFPELGDGETASRTVRGRDHEPGLGKLLQDRIDGSGAWAVGSLEAGAQAADDVVAVPRLFGDQPEHQQAQRAGVEHARAPPASERAVAPEETVKRGARSALVKGVVVAGRRGTEGHGLGSRAPFGGMMLAVRAGGGKGAGRAFARRRRRAEPPFRQVWPGPPFVALRSAVKPAKASRSRAWRCLRSKASNASASSSSVFSVSRRRSSNAALRITAGVPRQVVRRLRR